MSEHIFKHIIGGTPEQKQKVKTELTKRFNNPKLSKKAEQYEITPTPEEQEAIEAAVAYANDLSKKFGGVPFEASRVFLVKKGGIFELTDHDLETGFYDTFDNIATIDQQTHPALTAEIAVHEALHAIASKTIWVDEDGDDHPYRTGISMRGIKPEDRKIKKVYFEDLEEAIMATLSKRFFDEYVTSHPEYAEEFRKIEAVKIWFKEYRHTIPDLDEQRKEETLTTIDDILFLPHADLAYEIINDPTKSSGYKAGYLEGLFEEVDFDEVTHERRIEREKFEGLLERLVTASHGKYGDKENIFERFVQAHISGRWLPLARMIEDILGPGSFRRTAEEFAKVEHSDEMINLNPS